MRKTFKNNDEYFKFYNENKDKIKLWSINLIDDNKIKILYEKVVINGK